MGFDLHMVPASGFLKWTDEQWDQFFEKNDAAREQLGKSRYVGFVLFTIVHHLEAGQAGSKFPLVMRLHAGDDRVGWYHEDLDALLRELDTINRELAAIPVNAQTVTYDIPDWAEKFVADFKRRNPGRPLNSLADLTFYFFETLRAFVMSANSQGQGVFVSY